MGSKLSIENLKTDIKSIPKWLRWNKKRTSEIAKVAFLCQYIPAWNKMSLLYDTLVQDLRFRVDLVCVPSEIEADKWDGCSNDVYDYYINHGYSAINAVIGQNQWFDLESQGYDYIFYTRPYNTYMPAPYKSGNVRKYSKICIIMYATTLTEQGVDTALNKDFFKDVYLYFAETSYVAEKCRDIFALSHKLGLRKTYALGMPVLEQLINDKNLKSESWEFAKNKFRVMWTPRWSTDSVLGGSNFFQYYQRLLDYAQENPTMDLLVRPHPLAFDNFIKTGEMTSQEVADYKQRIQDAANVSLDTQKEYNATFWNASVLVSDLSGMMPEFFVTGKPIIYCDSNVEWDYAKHTQKMLDVCYVAKNEEELFGYLDQLQQGLDPLKEKRIIAIQEIFGASLEGAAKRIADRLYG